MRAARLRQWGGPEQVEIARVDEPELQPGQVLVAVRAAALNYPDLLLMANRYQVSVPAPFVIGSEFAGEVVAVAPGVDTIAVGDRVAGAVMVGAFAERVAVNAGDVSRVPDALDWPSAAGFSVAYRTAYHALVSFGEVCAGTDVIVLGAGGGVGAATVDLAVAMGARVIAVTSSADRAEFLRSRGAHITLDRRDPELRAQLKQASPHGASAVIDPVGGPTAELALRALGWGGRFVVVGFASGEIPRIPLNLPLIKGLHIVGFELRTVGHHRPDFVVRADRALADLAARGLKPAIGAVHSLDDVAIALTQMQNAEVAGKSIVVI
ncbi:MAG: 2-haloacrylate reductase [Pseudonocardiales bacterium]|nr:2-haloacrylate reductase [Pseudonocardiales bacterium]